MQSYLNGPKSRISDLCPYSVCETVWNDLSEPSLLTYTISAKILITGSTIGVNDLSIDLDFLNFN